MKRLVALMMCAVSLGAAAQSASLFLYDGDQSGAVSLPDLLGLLSEYGVSDIDFDGIVDSQDNCIDLEACNFNDSSAMECLYVDECGKCGGEGATIESFVGVEILYDSIYVADIDMWLQYEVGVDSIFVNECPQVQNCRDHDFVVYEGVEYGVVVIDNKCWFTENAKYLPFVNAPSEVSTSSPRCYVYGYSGNIVEDARNAESFNESGVRYNWPALAGLAICPVGWEIPTISDYGDLLSFVEDSMQSSVGAFLAQDGIVIPFVSGFEEVDGYLLRSEEFGGRDLFGFKSVPTYRLGNSGQWLTGWDELGSRSQNYNNTRRLRWSGSNAYLHDDGNQADAFGTRCIKDAE